MKKEKKPAGKLCKNEITLRLNNCFTNDPCAICGGRCDPCGFDFFDRKLNLKGGKDEMKKELRFREKSITMSNQQIIEFAYLTQEIIKSCWGEKLYFEQANCYLTCFYKVRELLKQVNAKYLAKHERVVDFFRDVRVLSNEWDRLHWVNCKQPNDCADCFEKVPCKK